MNTSYFPKTDEEKAISCLHVQNAALLSSILLSFRMESVSVHQQMNKAKPEFRIYSQNRIYYASIYST